ncbi:MAG: Maf family protein, partial [Promethearchaeota archaeon]
LASKSEDRRELFTRSGIPFEVLPTQVDEREFKNKISDPKSLVRELAKAKALYAKKQLEENNKAAIIIAADTIVELNGEIIGKAKDEDDAIRLLKKLMGKTHNLITGIVITETENSKLFVDLDITVVEFLNLSTDEIYNYVKTNEWKGRAGAYSINDKASLFIKKIQGSSSNVIGFPMHKLYEILRNEFGINLLTLGTTDPKP